MIYLINLSLYKRIILVYLCTARASSIADSFLAEIRDVHGFKFTAVGVMIFGITRVVAEPRHAVVWAISARGTYFVGILDNIVDITSEKKWYTGLLHDKNRYPLLRYYLYNHAK